MRGRARARLGLASVRLHPAYMDDSGVSSDFTGENRSLIFRVCRGSTDRL